MFCSRACYDAGRKTPSVSLQCKHCGTEFCPLNKSFAARKRRIYCSKPCHQAACFTATKGIQWRPEHFWSSVEKSDGCWLWTGCRDKKGYGRIMLDGHSERAYRHAWRLTHGAIPDGLFVLHKCDNPPCVRPDHLYVGTKGDNLRDRISRFPETCPKGATHGQAKLSQLEVNAIRRLSHRGHSANVLAGKFHVVPETIRDIRSGRTWKSVK